ncbi:MAG: helix-turn-helix domain-containing protein [Rhodospirillales bacterium]
MNSIGEKLREERLRLGFSIEQIAEITKINLSFLEAIEANELERLPGTFFTRSFIRQYAHALGIDAAELEPELERIAGAGNSVTRETEFEREAISVPPVDSGIGRSRTPRSLGALATFVLILAGCSGLYILWQRRGQAPPPETAAAPQVQQVHAEPGPAITPAVEQPQAPAPPPPEPAKEAPPPAEPAKEPPPPAEPQLSPVKVQIRATAPSWVRLAADGKLVFSGTLQADETRAVEAQQVVELRTGNAAGLEVIWNGKPAGQLGAEGQVRNAEFTPSGFRVFGSPAPKPDVRPAEAP